MDNSRFLNLNWGDLLRALVVAILAGFALPVLAALQSPGFDLATANWSLIISLGLNGGLAAGAGYLTKNLFTDNAGKLLGKF